MVICKIPISAFEKSIFSSPEIYGNTVNIFWGGIKTTKISVYHILRYLKLSFIVRDHGVWPPPPFIETLVSQKKRLVECGVVRMGGPVFTTFTAYLIPTSQ